ncbi:hypothetical protein BDZ89DRAFT_1113545 [Hymenopellis radicata]|nr:hypothetical protein BDZ89DRAFT_1113545 [Hymenopellis radicata]
MADTVNNQVHASQAEVWYLKEIAFGTSESRIPVKIITQNFNGPCSFIAICNILILRGAITIEPPGRKTVSYEFLSQLVGEYLLLTCPGIDISAALSIMPYTQKGMDLNPLFTGSTSFRPGGSGGELDLFKQAEIELVHGWLVDPESPEASLLAKTPDYDSAVMLIADADHITKGQLVRDDSRPQTPVASGSSSSAVNNHSEEEREKIANAIAVREFLDSTRSQLTYHGLFHLASTIKPGSLVALYRNLHLSVLYKRHGDDSSLYSLVTDYVFLREPSVVWERLEDVDGGWSTFVDSDFVKASPAGGDFAGQTAEDALRAAEIEAGNFVASDPADLALAQQLQSEEDSRARYEYDLRRREEEKRRQAEINKRMSKQDKSRKAKKDCLIM